MIDENGNQHIKNKVDIAIQRIRDAYNLSKSNDRPGSDKPLWVSYSGGKDSTVLLELVKRSGVPYEAHYNVTSVDPPELVHFIQRQSNVHIDIPRDKEGNPITMWNLIPRKLLPPTRVVRYCCQYLKECAGKNRINLTGVRWAESSRRKKSWRVLNFKGKRAQKMADKLELPYEETYKNQFAIDLDRIMEDVQDDCGIQLSEETVALGNDNSSMRQMMEYCIPRGKTVLNPIIDWTDEDVWEFIETENLAICELYHKSGGGGDLRDLDVSDVPLQNPKTGYRSSHGGLSTKRTTLEHLTVCFNDAGRLADQALHGVMQMKSWTGGWLKDARLTRKLRSFRQELSSCSWGHTKISVRPTPKGSDNQGKAIA